MSESHFQRVASDLVRIIDALPKLHTGFITIPRGQENLYICAMIGLARATDCPRTYDNLASNLWPDGVWGEHAHAAYDFLKQNK